jgi:tetratricopeptide (TPR) repeat protein
MRGISLLVLALTSASALAEPTKADLLFDEGKKLEGDGKWQEACEKFAASSQLDPEAPGTLLNLGLCNEKLGKLATAIDWYKKAEDHARRFKMKEYEQEAGERTKSLEPRVPIVKIEFAQELPAGGQVTLDGKPVRTEDVARFGVDPGSHDLVITAPHVKRVDKKITVEEGKEQTVQVDAWVTTHTMMRDDGKTKRRLAYGLGAAAIILEGVNVTVGLVERSKYNDAKSTIQERNDADDAVRLWSTATFAAGLVAGGLAVYFYVTAPKAETYEAVLPIVSTDEVGVAYTHRF